MRCSHYRSTEHPSPPTPSSPPITTKPTKYTGQTMESDFSSFVLIGSSFCSSFFVFSPFPHSWAHHSPSSPSCSHSSSSSHQSSSVRPFNTPVTIKSMRELRQWSMTVASLKRLTRERERSPPHFADHWWDDRQWKSQRSPTKGDENHFPGISSPGTCLSIGVHNISLPVYQINVQQHWTVRSINSLHKVYLTTTAVWRDDECWAPVPTTTTAFLFHSAPQSLIRRASVSLKTN